MAAAIAYMGNHDLEDDRVRTFIKATALGCSIADLARGTGIKVGNALGKALVTQIPKQLIGKINKFFGVKLVTKFGQKGAVQLGKAIPLFGGIVGATVNVVTTKIAGKCAKEAFIARE